MSIDKMREKMAPFSMENVEHYCCARLFDILRCYLANNHIFQE